MQNNKLDLIVLGCGYVGGFLLKKHPNIFYTHRKKISFDDENKNQIFFDLQDESTWKNIPHAKNILWTFPAASCENDIEKSLLFFNEYLKNKNVIVLSSTSAYVQNFENENIDENSKLNLNLPRFFAEENLRHSGALILHLSGIIGPERTPLGWYKKGLVKYGENILNYIHVYDILFFIEKLFADFKNSERFNLTSQDYKTHNKILEKLIKKGFLPSEFEFESKNESSKSKKIQCDKILDHLKENNYRFVKYPEDVEN